MYVKLIEGAKLSDRLPPTRKNPPRKFISLIGKHQTEPKLVAEVAMKLDFAVRTSFVETSQ